MDSDAWAPEHGRSCSEAWAKFSEAGNRVGSGRAQSMAVAHQLVASTQMRSGSLAGADAKGGDKLGTLSVCGHGLHSVGPEQGRVLW